MPGLEGDTLQLVQLIGVLMAAGLAAGGPRAARAAVHAGAERPAGRRQRRRGVAAITAQ